MSVKLLHRTVPSYSHQAGPAAFAASATYCPPLLHSLPATMTTHLQHISNPGTIHAQHAILYAQPITAHEHSRRVSLVPLCWTGAAAQVWQPAPCQHRRGAEQWAAWGPAWGGGHPSPCLIWQSLSPFCSERPSASPGQPLHLCDLLHSFLLGPFSQHLGAELTRVFPNRTDLVSPHGSTLHATIRVAKSSVPDCCSSSCNQSR